MVRALMQHVISKVASKKDVCRSQRMIALYQQRGAANEKRKANQTINTSCGPDLNLHCLGEFATSWAPGFEETHPLFFS